MKTRDTIATQRAVREFSDEPVKPKQIRRILDAGRRAPSSNNEQRWAFIVVQERDRLTELGRVGMWSSHVGGAAFAVALVTPDADEHWVRESIAFDLGQAAQNMMLEAWDLGIGSCHASVYDPELAQRLLGYPDGLRCDYVISFGHPREEAKTRKQTGRRPLDELRHDERYQE
jgi:nitroreductase